VGLKLTKSEKGKKKDEVRTPVDTVRTNKQTNKQTKPLLKQNKTKQKYSSIKKINLLCSNKEYSSNQNKTLPFKLEDSSHQKQNSSLP
jgi:mannitol-specific phosphotransferase system IIBC component